MVELALPATRNGFQDALQRARIADGHHCNNTAVHCKEKSLSLCRIAESDDLYEWNLLAMRLTDMTEEDLLRFSGLVTMELRESDGTLSVPQLINLTMNLKYCTRKAEIRNDEALGRFFCENNAAPSFFTERIDMGVEPRLVYAQIGQYRRERHHGVFTKDGYIECEMLQSRYSPGQLPYFPKPEDVLVLEYLDETIMLPKDAERFRTLKEEPFLVTDCAVPWAWRWIQNAQDQEAILQFAGQLAEAAQRGTLPKYKALLEAAACQSLQEADFLYQKMDEFEFQQEMVHIWDYAKAEMETKYSYLPAELYQSRAFQCSLERMEQDHAGLTAYGMVRRLDRQPISLMAAAQESAAMQNMV